MAYEIPVLRHTVKAGADLTGSQYCCVVLDGTTGLAELPGSASAIIGVLQNAPDTGEDAAIESKGITKAVAGDTIAPMDALETDTDGNVVPLDAGVKIGTAITGGADGNIITILLA